MDLNALVGQILAFLANAVGFFGALFGGLFGG
jgi:hypothetical protein